MMGIIASDTLGRSPGQPSRIFRKASHDCIYGFPLPRTNTLSKSNNVADASGSILQMNACTESSFLGDELPKGGILHL